MTSSNNQPLSIGFLLRIFAPFAAGYFLSYLFRVVNTIIASDLSGDLSLDASQLGMLTSVLWSRRVRRMMSGGYTRG